MINDHELLGLDHSHHCTMNSVPTVPTSTTYVTWLYLKFGLHTSHIPHYICWIGQVTPVAWYVASSQYE